jgi:serine-type D-Ala-D-Ala carboxypeptidase/endopeptidase (penicillin-binding protein 4)
VLLAAVLLLPSCAARTPPAAGPLAGAALSRTAAPASAAVRQLRSDLSQVFGAPISARGSWGVEVRSLDTGEQLFEHDAGRLMMPASNLKVLTLAAAAETLGWDYRYTTTLETTGTIADGVLHGDLIVRSNGDPTINTRGGRAAHVIDDWLAALAAAGIREVDGRIVGNDQAFDDNGLGVGWAWDYLQYYYAAPVGALQYNENVAAMVVTPAAAPGLPPTITIEPGSGLTIVNRATTGAPDSEITVDAQRQLDHAILDVFGGVPAGAPAVIRPVAVVNPTIFFAQSLKAALTARGVGVRGEAIDFDDIAAETLTGASSGSPRVIATTTSPPLREIAATMMKVSQNLYAETLLKTVGAARGGLGTVAAGSAAVRQLMTSWQIPEDGYVAVDGSGLSRYNYVAASTLATVLERLYRDPKHRDAFVATLPIAGKDGTIASRMRRTRAEGNAVAKTGSISNVRTLSGFVRTRGGEMLVFAILANDFVIPAATINWIADLAVETLANFTRR